MGSHRVDYEGSISDPTLLRGEFRGISPVPGT